MVGDKNAIEIAVFSKSDHAGTRKKGPQVGCGPLGRGGYFHVPVSNTYGVVHIFGEKC